MSDHGRHDKSVIKEKLNKEGIKTLQDLDKWSLAHPYTDKWGRPACMSRYDVLKKIVGEDAADIMMNELALKQCCLAHKKSKR